MPPVDGRAYRRRFSTVMESVLLPVTYSPVIPRGVSAIFPDASQNAKETVVCVGISLKKISFVIIAYPSGGRCSTSLYSTSV